MRQLLVIATLVLSLAGPGLAVSNAALPYDLKLSGPLGQLPGKAQVQSGSSFGGVPVTGTIKGTSTAGSFTLYADGKIFASGTYSCASACSFTGTIAGKSVSGMSLTSSTSSLHHSSLTVTGLATSSAFSNHGAWVSSVAHWANTNLPAVQRGRVISGAAKIEGHLVSGRTDPSHGRSQAKGQDEDKGKTNDNDKAVGNTKGGKDDDENGNHDGNGSGSGNGNGGGSDHGKP